MSISLSGQLFSLAMGLLLGVGVGLLYDMLRQLRLACPLRCLAEGLDLLFWLLACLTLFFCGVRFGGGQVRLYMALWLSLGGTAYFAVLSRLARQLLAILVGFLLFSWLRGHIFQGCENFFEKSLFFFSGRE